MNYIIKRAREESDGPAAALRAAVCGRRGGAGGCLERVDEGVEGLDKERLPCAPRTATSKQAKSQQANAARRKSTVRPQEERRRTARGELAREFLGEDAEALLPLLPLARVLQRVHLRVPPPREAQTLAVDARA